MGKATVSGVLRPRGACVFPGDVARHAVLEACKSRTGLDAFPFPRRVLASDARAYFGCRRSFCFCMLPLNHSVVHAMPCHVLGNQTKALCTKWGRTMHVVPFHGFNVDTEVRTLFAKTCQPPGLPTPVKCQCQKTVRSRRPAARLASTFPHITRFHSTQALSLVDNLAHWGRSI